MINEYSLNKRKNGYYIGMMSGTSLDGMDAVIVKFTDNEPLQLIASHTHSFDEQLKSVLLALCQPNGVNQLPTSSMSELDWFGWASRAYAQFASQVVKELLTKTALTHNDIMAIGCHGQTVRHRPEHGFTLQLVDPNVLAEQTTINVISDFRRRDMAVGGQGAPLVPAFHKALFADNDSNKVILNLGGIANITVLHADDNNAVTGYDTGPANLLIDAWALKHIGKAYDDNGNFARDGEVIEALLEQMLQHQFFAKSAPKSTGREDFHLDWVHEQLQQYNQSHCDSYTPADVQSTLTELTARSICNEVATHHQEGQLFVCGGGSYNGYLLGRLQSLLGSQWQVMSTETLGLAPTWVEAVAFAWLARQTMLGEVANLPVVTGATKSVVLGQICFA